MNKTKWNKEKSIKEFNSIIKSMGHFPTNKELKKLHRYDLLYVIHLMGGVDKLRDVLGFDQIQKPYGFWTDETTIEELKIVIEQLNHFPRGRELREIGRCDLEAAIYKCGGLPKFRKLLGYEYTIQKPDGYWKDDNNILEELRYVIGTLCHFPKMKELTSLGRVDLINAINKRGGVNKFRKLMGYDFIKVDNGHWSEETAIRDIKIIEKDIGHFPSKTELILMDRQDLCYAIDINGGYPKFKSLLGHTISIQEKYISKLASYCVKRGKKTEKLVSKILQDYCNIHHIQRLQYNKRLSKGNVIEFVCNTNKRIGIDVTNTENKEIVYRKWKKKSYHTHLDELWIVVFSDAFNQSDYHKWNQESPDNVKVMSVYQFLEELDYSLDQNLKSKIDDYCSCTFHTKGEFIKKININTENNNYVMLKGNKYNLCTI